MLYALDAWTFDDGQPEEAAAYFSDCQEVQLFSELFEHVDVDCCREE